MMEQKQLNNIDQAIKQSGLKLGYIKDRVEEITGKQLYAARLIKIRKNEIQPRLDELMALAQVLECDYNELLTIKQTNNE